MVAFVKMETLKELTMLFLVKLKKTVISNMEKVMKIMNSGLLLMSDSVKEESEKNLGEKLPNVILQSVLNVPTLFV